ncbi:ATP-grasp domain-containing protein [Hymenobacter sp. ASUV-10]|uniref:ATP-grasp domain-containing protein n=1 Tax=Hymenobacter aranciens TaxID=3063996 RepID=A0ABT9BF75_9BACT|nr:ATP-grasp domain-containing protein [Hymenobacter sp. ASUV-10]MDO7876308.1 ATP-grasp domain-containing protein [Hymenobacter sp. ASUV-10]
MLNSLLPSLPYQRLIDPMWEEEATVARQHGHNVCLFDDGQQRIYQPINPQLPTLYRGWMLTASEYQRLTELTPLLVSPAEYLASHQAIGWYKALTGLTPRSEIVAAGEAEEAVAAFINQRGKCFVKGLSKSFEAQSVVTSLTEFQDLLSKQGIEPTDKLFVREFIDLADTPEQRFFVVRGEAFGATGQAFPEALKPALQTLQNRWFCTIDVAFTSTGAPLIIEVGDGQVSDTKEWTVSELYQSALARLAALANQHKQ